MTVAGPWPGRHFDGRTPEPHDVSARVESGSVVVSSGGEEQRWSIESIVVIRDGRRGDPVQLELPGEPTQALFVQDSSFFAAIRDANAGRAPRRLGGGDVGLKWAAGLVLAGALLLFGAWKWGVPALAAAAAQVVPPAWEREFGAMVLSDFVTADRRVTDERVVRPVRDVFQRLVSVTTASDSFSVTVMREGMANAFALPGGFVVVTTGLLKVLRGPEELAAVLAHEIAHVSLDHTTRGLLERQGLRALAGLVAGDASVLGSVVGTAATLGELSYGRSDEQEADDEAGALLARAGLAPMALAGALESLERAAPAGGRNLGFLSTHPATRERLERVRSRAAQLVVADAATPLDQAGWDAMRRALPDTSATSR